MADILKEAAELLDVGYDDGFGVTSLDTLLCEQMCREKRLDFAAFILREARSKQAREAGSK
jgi:hypothetical protein